MNLEFNMNKKTTMRELIIKAFNAYFQDGDKGNLAIQFYYVNKMIRNNKDIVIENDDVVFLKLMESVLKDDYTKKEAELEYLYTLKSIVIDKMFISATTNVYYKNNIVLYTGTEKICYLDRNVFRPYINNEIINYEIPDGYIVPYSPALIEEIDKSRQEYHEPEMQRIREKTGCLEILFSSKDGFHICKEDPLDCYKRINGTSDRVLAEEAKLLDDKIQTIMFEGCNNEKDRIQYNNLNPDTFLLEHEDLVDKILKRKNVPYVLQDIKENGNCNDYFTLNGYIHILYSVMDICGFKKDNREREIRSSRLDIEHLLYASVADIFLTKDAKLRCRAKNIFGVLGRKVICPDI